MNNSQKIIDIIEDNNNCKHANTYTKVFSSSVIQEIYRQRKKDPNLIYELMFIIQAFIERNFPIENRTLPPMIMRSFLYTLFIVMPFLIFVAMIFKKLEVEDKESIKALFAAYCTSFLAIFVYSYITFNNKWRYLADLFNKIYYDGFKNDNKLEHFRKKLILAQDINDLNMTQNKSFKHDFFYTLTMASLIYKSLLNSENKKIIEISKDKIEFLILPNIILEKVTSFVIKNIDDENLNEARFSGDDINEQLKSLNDEINSLKDDIVKINSFLENDHKKLQKKLNELQTEKQLQMNSNKPRKKINNK